MQVSKDPFVYQKPSEPQTETLSKLREKAKELGDLILTELPHGRYRSLAMTALEESSAWANKACVFELAEDGCNAPRVEVARKEEQERAAIVDSTAVK